MRVVIDCLVRFGLAPLLLLLALAPLAQAQSLVVNPIDPAGISGLIEIAKARTEVAGSDNLEYVHNNLPGSDTAAFTWNPGQLNDYTWSYDGETLDLSVGDLDPVSVQRPSFDRIEVLVIQCQATDPFTQAFLDWEISPISTPGMIIPGGVATGTLEVNAAGPTFQAVSLSGPIFYSFAVTGQIRKGFESPPSAAGLSCSFIVAARQPNDRDGDLVLDDEDICPDVFDPNQVDSDGDGKGDPCDLCPDVPDNGLADDFDNDGVPDPCDNCPRSFCVESEALDASQCYNPSQADPDEDGVGGVVGAGCDNCPVTFNPPENGTPGPPLDGTQPDDDLDGVGNACGPTGGQQQEIPGEEIPAGGGAILASVSALGEGTASAVGDPRLFAIRVECGPFNAAEFTVGVGIPPDGSARFAGCAEPLLSDPTREGLCSAAPDCGPGETVGCLDPANVDKAASFTLGPGIALPNIPAPPPPDNFYMHVEGNRDVGLSRRVLCEENEVVQVGVLEVTGLDPEETISLTTVGLDNQPLDLFLVVDSEAGAVPVAQTTTTDLAGEGDELAIVTISPSLGDAAGIFETQVTFLSDQLVSNLCVGFEASTPIGPGDVLLGGCDDPVVISRPDGAGGTNDVPFLACTDDAGGPPPGRGPGVLAGAVADPPISYVLEADTPEAAFLGLPEDTTYWVMRGALEKFVPPFFAGFSVNNAGSDSLLGTHRYLGAPQPAPRARFDGCQAILDFIGDPAATAPIVVFPSGTILASQVTRISSFDSQGDLDFDGVPNNSDNCINAANALQQDRGRSATNIIDAQVSDGAGDSCQCGDGQLDTAAEPGSVLLVDSAGQSDLDECRRAAAGDPTLDPEASARCSVAGDFRVTAADLLLLSQALDENVEEVTPNDIEQVCQPALVPPTP